MLREEDEHLCGRIAITPTFHQGIVQEHTGMVVDTIKREIASWPLDTIFPTHPFIRSLTLRVLLNAILIGEDDVLQRLHTHLLGMLSFAGSFVMQEPRLRYLPGWCTTWRQFVKQRTETDKLIFGFIDRRRRETGDHGDLLDVLLAAHNPDDSPMSDRQVRDNLMSIILAGHETTAGELAWAFQLLAHNPTVQNRLIEEIDSGTGEEYLAATVQEIMRHKPVFLFTIPRAVVKPIEIGGFTYHPPAHLLGCTYLMHHDPKLYPEPHAFRPERFLGKTPQAGTWLPWGAGRKRCPGRHLALMEIQAVLREVLATRFVLPASPRIEHPRWRSAILVPHAGSRVILRRRRRRPGTNDT
jgi:cytochrome P450